jgi:hypothetical protein
VSSHLLLSVTDWLIVIAGEGNFKPTPRAITERLVKLRQIAGPGANKLSISQGRGTANAPPVTPRKPRTAGGVSSGSGKRKRGKEPAIKPDPDAEEDTAVPEPASQDNGASPFKKGHVKMESDDINLADLNEDEESPSKRVRKQTSRPDMVVFQDDSEDSKKGHKYNTSSGSEFVPEKAKNESVGQENATKMDVAEDDEYNEEELWA